MDNITVVVPTSYIPSHPSTKILDETLSSIRTHLPTARIIVTCDGLQAKDALHRAEYGDYMDAISGVNIIRRYAQHVHQSGMLFDILALVETPLMLYLEHDWVLGFPIEWGLLEEAILAGPANYVKFYQGFRIHPLHEHMMVGRLLFKDVPLIQTLQYSANPHLASTAWYRSLKSFFRGQTDYIENLLHGPIATAPWEDYKLTIYNPIQGDMKRSYHLDGAGSR